MDNLWFIYDAVFIDNLKLYSKFSQNLIAYTNFTCISDFVNILAKRYCKSFMASAYALLGKS